MLCACQKPCKQVPLRHRAGVVRAFPAPGRASLLFSPPPLPGAPPPAARGISPQVSDWCGAQPCLLGTVVGLSKGLGKGSSGCLYQPINCSPDRSPNIPWPMAGRARGAWAARGRGRASVELRGVSSDSLGPLASSHLALVCVTVRICLTPRSLAGVCWGESSLQPSKWLSKCLLPHHLGP